MLLQSLLTLKGSLQKSLFCKVGDLDKTYTKREVKMTSYDRIVAKFFVKDKNANKKKTKPTSSHHDRTSLVNIWLKREQHFIAGPRREIARVSS